MADDPFCFAEKFLGLADFGALQVADLRGDLVQRRRDDGERTGDSARGGRAE
jgi:hypothetical protein